MFKLAKYNAIQLAGIFTFGLFLLHYLLPSMINGFDYQNYLTLSRLDNAYMEQVYHLHQTEAAFARRPITSQFIFHLTQIGLSVGAAFSIINFLFLFFDGLIICAIAKQLGLKGEAIQWSVISFFGCFSILFSFFSTIYSYDEPIQYFFILAALYYLINTKFLFFSILFSFGLLVRESGLILMPGVLYFIYKNKSFHLKSIVAIIFPIVFYFTIQHYFFAEFMVVEQNRFLAWQYNFQNFQFGIESLVSGILIIAPAIYFLFYNKKNTTTHPLVGSFIITCILNVTIVLLSTKARESRLFALPLIFVWGILGQYIFEWKNVFLQNIQMSKTIDTFEKAKIRLFTKIIAFAGISFFLYRPSNPNGMGMIYQTYFLIVLLLLFYPNSTINQEQA